MMSLTTQTSSFLKRVIHSLFFVVITIFCNPVVSFTQVLMPVSDRLFDDDILCTTLFNPLPNGITVITHGFQLFGDIQNLAFLDDYAAAIKKRAGGRVNIYTNDALGNWIDAGFGNTNDKNDEIILLYNWGIYSGVVQNGYLEASADNLFAMLLNPPQILGISRDEFLGKTKHFIGHSRGSVLMVQVFHRFKAYFGDTKIEQFTSLDPHPAEAMGDHDLNGVLEDNVNSNLGRNKYKLVLPINVIKADNFYQMRGEYEPNVPYYDGFDGVYVEGSNNFLLASSNLNSQGCNLSLGTTGDEHSKVHAYYYYTILPFCDIPNDEYPNCRIPPQEWYPNDTRGDIGFNKSRLGGNFNWASPLPSAADLRKGDERTIPKVSNGDFSGLTAGWDNNGAVRIGINAQEATLSNIQKQINHSLMYFPNNQYLKFKVKNISGSGKLRVIFNQTNSTIDNPYSVDISQSNPLNKIYYCRLPSNIKDKTGTLSFQFEGVNTSASVTLDDVTLDDAAGDVLIQPLGLCDLRVVNPYSSILTPTSFTVNWAGVVGATEYIIRVVDATQNDYNNPLREEYTGANQTTKDITGLESRKQYKFKVKAKCSSGIWGAWSDEVVVNTPILVTTPTNVQASDGTYTGYIEIKWKGSPNNRFRVYRNTTNSIVGATPLGVMFLQNDFFSDASSSLTPGVPYYYFVVAASDLRGSNASDFSMGDTGLKKIPQPSGSVKITINPVGARNAGARWRIDNGEWYSSGQTMFDVPIGTRSLSFKSGIAGYNAPATRDIEVNLNAEFVQTYDYTPCSKSLRITSPLSGTYQAGQTMEVIWNTSGCTGSKVNIELAPNTSDCGGLGSSVGILILATENDGRETVTINSQLGAGVYKVKIYETYPAVLPAAKNCIEGTITVEGATNLSTVPSTILSPVIGRLVVGSSAAAGVWSFWQHQSGVHTSSGGIGGADDTYAWDINMINDEDAGKPVSPIADGVVIGNGGWGGSTYGQVLIEHTNPNGTKWYSGYLHMISRQTVLGMTVRTTDIIGYIGSAGATNNHLHFAVYYKNISGKFVSVNANISERNTNITPFSLILNSAQSFGTTNLTEGTAYTYITQIKNIGGQSWSGSVYLRVNGRDIANRSYEIAVGTTQNISFSYTPTNADVGTNRTVQIYYQTGGVAGQGNSVPQGSYSNPTNVNITTGICAKSLTVTSPLTGTYTTGNQIDITWDKSGCISNSVTIELADLDCRPIAGGLGVLVENTANDGLQSVTINSQLGTGTYRVKIYEANATGTPAQSCLGTISILRSLQSGSVNISLLPTAAVSAGAQWNIDGGTTYYSSGFTLSNVAVGAHTIGFKTVNNWNAPAPQTIQVAANSIFSQSYTYSNCTTKTLTLMSPLSGSFARGSQIDVTWNRSGCVSSLVTIEISNNCNGIAGTGLLIENTPNDGSERVTINSALLAGTYQIKIYESNAIGTPLVSCLGSISVTVPPQYGSVNVTLLPVAAVSAGAKWNIDGGSTYYDSGFTLPNVTVGTHTIGFKTVTGWDAPASQSVTVLANTTVSQTYTYSACTAKTLTLTSPLSGSFVRGSQIDVTWNKSGCVSSLVTIEISNNCNGIAVTGLLVENTSNDGSERVTINSALLAGTYQIKIYESNAIGTPLVSCLGSISVTVPPQYGSVNVTLLPAAAVSAGAQWNIDGGTYYNSGLTLSNIAVGTHTIGFKTVTGWVAPSSQSVSVTANTTVSQSYTYSACAKSLTITSPLSGTFTAGNQIDVTWNKSGCISSLITIELANTACDGVGATGVLIEGTTNDGSERVTINSALGAGTYKVKIYEYNPTGTLVKDCIVGTVSIVAAPQYGSLNVNLFPSEAVNSGAQWNIDGGRNYYASNTTLSNVSAGTHIIGFKDVTGWIAPNAQSIIVTANQTTSKSYTYSACAKSLTVTSPLTGIFTAGNQLDVTWNSTGCASSLVTIELANINCDGIGATGVLAEGTPNDGIQRVTINSQLASGTYKVKIYEYNPIGTLVKNCIIGTIIVQAAPQYGSINVTLLPAAAVSTGAQWNIDGGTYYNSGLTLSNVSIGTHTIGFKALTAWNAPASQSVMVVANSTVSPSYTYSACTNKSLTLTSPLSGTFSQGQQIDVTWSSSGCISNLVTIELTTSTTNCDASGVVAVLAPNTPNDGIQQVTIPTTITSGAYKIKIYEANPVGIPAVSCLANNLTISNVSTPQNVQATDGSLTDRVRITWTGTAGNYFKVYRNTVNNNTSGTAISGWQSTPLSFDDLTAIAGTTYFYYVIAASTIVGSNASTPSAINSGYFGTACGSPTFSHSNVTTNSAFITWSPISGASSYKITYIPQGGTGLTVQNLTGLTHTLTGLVANTQYAYTVQAVCGSVTSAYTGGLTFTTSSDPTLDVSPATISFSSSGGTATFAITSNSSWVINRIPTLSTWVSTNTGSGTGNTTITVNCQSNTSVDSRTATFRVSLGSGFSKEVVVTQSGVASCADPNPSITNVTSNSGLITWNSVAGATSYTVGVTGGGLSLRVPNLQGFTYPLTGLAANTTYAYTVQAVCGSINSSYTGRTFTTPSLSAYNVRTAICAGVQSAAPYDLIDERSNFGYSEKVYSWMRIDNINEQLRMRMMWFAPDGMLISDYTSDWFGPFGNGSYWVQHRWLGPSLSPGRWSVSFFIGQPNGSFEGINTKWFNVSPTGLIEDLDEKFSTQSKRANTLIYPNPVTNELNIEMSSSEESDVQLSVSDILGKEITHFNKTAIKGLNHYQINTVNLNNGLYLLHIKSKEGVTSHKFTVQH